MNIFKDSKLDLYGIQWLNSHQKPRELLFICFIILTLGFHRQRHLFISEWLLELQLNHPHSRLQNREKRDDKLTQLSPFPWRNFSSFFRKLLLISHCPEISHTAKLNCKKGWGMQSFLIIHHLHLHPDLFPDVSALTSEALFTPQKNHLPNKWLLLFPPWQKYISRLVFPASWETCMQVRKQVRHGHGTTDWFQIGKGVHQGCILSPCLFNLYAEYITRNAGLEEAQLESRLPGEISVTSDMQMTPPLWQKVKRN